jgi:hypothetical protein
MSLLISRCTQKPGCSGSIKKWVAWKGDGCQESKMSLTFDEYGRPFIVIREQAQKQRIRGLQAQRVIHGNKQKKMVRFLILFPCPRRIFLLQKVLVKC